MYCLRFDTCDFGTELQWPNLCISVKYLNCFCEFTYKWCVIITLMTVVVLARRKACATCVPAEIQHFSVRENSSVIQCEDLAPSYPCGLNFFVMIEDCQIQEPAAYVGRRMTREIKLSRVQERQQMDVILNCGWRNVRNFEMFRNSNGESWPSGDEAWSW